MLTPRYYYAEDFRAFHEYFLSQPHVKRAFQKGEYLWQAGKPYEKIHYILSGAEMFYADHENGHRKIISFHGPGTVFPGYRQKDFKIELSLTTAALSDMEVLEFTVPQFRAMFESNTALSECVIDWYSTFTNMFLFETIHQGYNPLQVKICNLLYLLSTGTPASSELFVDHTQDELAELLGISRVQLSRGLSALREQGIISTSRGKLCVTDLAALKGLCSSETV